MSNLHKRNSTPVTHNIKAKKRKNQLSESSEITKNGNCYGNNPVLEAFFQNRQNSTEPTSNLFLSPQIPLKKPKKIEGKGFNGRTSRVELPPLNGAKHPKNGPHFKSSQLICSFQKENDPIRAYGISNTEMSESPEILLNISKGKKGNMKDKKSQKFSSHKNLGYLHTDNNCISSGSPSTSSNNSFSRPSNKRHSNPKITIDLNDSNVSKNSLTNNRNNTSIQNDCDSDDTLGAGKFSHFELSQPGKDEKGKTKTNQDNYVMLESVFDNNSINFFGVMDGHGINGHLVSDYVKKSIPTYFTNKDLYITKTNKIISPDQIYKKLSYKDNSIIKNFFIDLNSELLSKAKFDVHFSGTTCVMVYQIEKKLICSNIGDSRAIVVTCDSNGNYFSEQLSYDHKPENPKEKERIIEKGGVLAPCNDEIDIGGPIRIWVKDEKYPGIAISRTLGDDVAHSVGVSCIPDIITKDITGEMCFLVVASDGVWEFLSNDKVKDIVLQYYYRNDPKGAATQVVREASKLWKEEGCAMDDITCIVYFLKSKHIKKSTV